MYFGLCVRVLVLSLLTFEQHANALNDRSGSFDHPRNHKPAFASAQPRGFLGSSRSSHNGGGKVDGYSPEGSVSSYGSSSLNIGKLTQNSKQPPQTNPNANGVIQATAGMWEIFSPIGGVSSPNVQPGSPFNPKQPGYTAPVGYQPKSQKPSFPPKPQQGALQTKAGMWDIFPPDGSGPNVQTGSPPKKPSFPPKPQQGVLQTKAGMWKKFYPDGGGSGHNVLPGPPPQLPQIVYRPQQPGYQPSVYHLKPKPKQPGYQPSIYQLKLLPGHPSLSGYLPKPSFPPNPQQGVLQTKAGIWDVFPPIGSGPNVQPESLPKKPSFPPKPQQGVLQTKAGMWDIVSWGVSSPNVQPFKPHQPGYTSPVRYQSKPQKPSFPPKPEQGVLQTKADMWNIFSPVGSGPKVQTGSPPKKPSFPPKPQQGVLQTKADMWNIFSPVGSGPKVQTGSPPKKPSFPPKPQQGVLQTKAGMWDIFSPNGGGSGHNVLPGPPPQLRQIVYSPQQPGYQPSVYQLKLLPGYPSLSGYPPKPSFPPNPQQGVLQTKAAMWIFHYPDGDVSGPEIQPGTPLKKPSFQPQQGVPQTKASLQPRSLSPTQQGVPQTKASVQPRSPSPTQQGVLQTKASVGISSPNVKPGFPSQQPSYQLSVSVHQPSYQPQLIGIQSKAGIWEFFSPDGRVSGPNVEPADLNIQKTVPPGSPHHPRWQQPLVSV